MKLKGIYSILLPAMILFSCKDNSKSDVKGLGDIDRIADRPDGNFNVICRDGSFETNVSREQIATDQVCEGLVEGGASVPASERKRFIIDGLKSLMNRGKTIFGQQRATLTGFSYDGTRQWGD